MSFGFSPSDVVLFSKFVGTVINSLREEGGSKVDYQLAQQQCEGFLDVMDTVQRLDLTKLPEESRNKLSAYTTSVQAFVKEFKAMILRYEKSMGKPSNGSWFKSAPRKVQWALMAADNVSVFRQRLAAQVNLVMLMINTSILHVLSGSTVNEQSLIHVGGNDGGRARIEWAAQRNDPDRHARLMNTVDNLSNLIYDRLLSRPPMELLGQGRVHTLPDTDSVPSAILQNTQIVKVPDILAASRKGSSLEIEGPAKSKHQIPLVDGMNGYLQSLDLEKLSDEEGIQVSGHEASISPLLVESPTTQTTSLISGNVFKGQGASSLPRSDSTPSVRQQNSPFQRVPTDGNDPLSGIEFATTAMRIIDLATSIPLFIGELHQDVRSAPDELLKLSRKIVQYVTLLHAASEILRVSLVNGELKSLGFELMKDSQQTMDEIAQDLKHNDPRTHKVQATMKKIRLKVFMTKAIQEMMGRVENLKSTFSMMMQLHQLQTAQQNLRSG